MAAKWLYCHPGGRHGGTGSAAARTTVAPVHWFFTGLLIAASAGTVAYTGYLVRRLFTTEPPTDAAS